MSAPRVIDITMVRGDSYALIFEIGANLTGYTLRMAVDPSEAPETDDDNLFVLAGTHVGYDSATGISTISFTPSTAQTNQSPGTYYHDIEVAAGSVVKTIIRGEFVVIQDRTK